MMLLFSLEVKVVCLILCHPVLNEDLSLIVCSIADIPTPKVVFEIFACSALAVK